MFVCCVERRVMKKLVSSLNTELFKAVLSDPNVNKYFRRLCLTYVANSYCSACFSGCTESKL